MLLRFPVLKVTQASSLISKQGCLQYSLVANFQFDKQAGMLAVLFSSKLPA
jgi:hypothetical protein